MRIASSDLYSFVFVKTASLQLQLPRRQLAVIMSVAQLSMHVPTPRVDFSEGGAGDSMSEPAFDGVDSLSCFFEARHQLRYIVGVHMAQAQLPILVVTTHCVY